MLLVNICIKKISDGLEKIILNYISDSISMKGWNPVMNEVYKDNDIFECLLKHSLVMSTIDLEEKVDLEERGKSEQK